MALIPPIHGVRVLRGPDWRVDDDTDGGEGHLGTVQGSHVDGTVDVLWDMGQETRCRAGQEGKFDLRILDTATVGVRHPGTCCTECEEQDIWGVLWRCQQCVASDLCSTCYNDDKHDLRHRFLRIDFPGAAGRLMKKRNVSVRIRSVGIFPGAKVVRGKNWEWKDQDGGEGSEGEVVEILNTASQHGNRNLVRVLWPSGKNDVYRLAYEGHVDVTCTDEEAGGFYYRDHLPCLDTAQFSTRKTTSSSPQGGNAEQVSPESAGVVDPLSADHDADNPSQTTDIADTTEDQHWTPGSPADDTTLPTSPLVSAITMDKLAEPSPHSHASHEIRRFLTATAGTSADHASGENAVESDLQDRSKSREERCHNPSEVDGDQQLARTEDMTPSDSAASCTEHSVQHLPAGDTGSGSVAMGSSETAADSETGTLPSGRRPEEPRSDCERRSSPQHSADPDRNGEVASCGATHRVTPPANQPTDTSEVSLPDTPSGAEANMDTGTKDDVSPGDKKDPAETVMSEKTDSQDSVAETTDSAGLVTVSEDKVDAVDAHTPARIQSCSQETRRETDGTDTMDHGRQGTDRAEDASQDLPPVCEKGLPDQTTEGNDCATSAVLGNDGTTPDIATGPQVPDTTMATSESGDLTDQTSAVGEVCDRKSDDPRHSSDVPMDQNGHLSSPDQGYLTSPEQGHLTSPEQGYLTSPEQTPSPQTQTTKGGTLDATEETPPTRDTTERKSPEFSEDLKTPATAPTSEIPETSQTLSSTHPPSAELLSARARSEPSDEELGATAAAPDTNVADSGPVPVSFFLKDTDPTEEITNEAGGGGQGGGFATDGENLTVGDTAVIAVPEVTLKELQAGYGGTTRRMIKKIGVEGKVAKVLPSGAVHLRLGKVVYRVNPDALVKTYPYNVGDTVRIREDLYLVRVLNHRIQWPNRMDQTAGKVGEVTRVDNDGDLRVRFGQCSYLYTPGCCVPAPGCSVDRVEERGSSLDIGSLMEESGDGDASSLLGRLTGLLSTGGGGGDGGGGGRGGRGHRIRLSDVAQLAQAGDDLDDQLRTLGSLNQQLGSLIRGAGGTMGGITLGGGGEDSAEGRLQMAVMEGDVDKVKAMCRADPRLVERDYKGVTPLMLASHEGRRKVVWALLDLGADINAGGAKEQCPLISALDRKKEDIALLLLERGASARQRNALQRTPLHCAVFNYQNEAAQMLLHMGSDVNAQDKHGDTPLHDCISRQNTVMVDLLLHQEGLNLGLVNKRGFTPLQLACMRENAQMLCLLLAKDSSSVNQLIDNDLAALHVCVKGRFLEGVRVLLSHGSADVNLPSGHRRQTALHMACLQGSTDLVQALVDIGASLNVQDRNGDTPLHMAMGGCDKSITSSQEREADIQTRIQIACQLISHGAFVDARNRKGKPPTVFGHDGTMAGVARFIARNPGLVRYKGRGDRATEAEGTGGRLQSSSVMTLREDVSMTCALCGGESDVTLRPCGHRCVCRTCADILMFCPLCDASVQSKEVPGRGAAAASPPHTRSQDTGSQPPASLNQSLSADTKDPDTSFRMNNRAMDDVTEEQEASTQDSRRSPERSMPGEASDHPGAHSLPANVSSSPVRSSGDTSSQPSQAPTRQPAEGDAQLLQTGDRPQDIGSQTASSGVEEDRSSGFIADDSSTPVGASREKERSAAAETTVESPPSAPKDTPVDVEKPGALESSQTEREELKTVESDPTGAEPSTSQPQDSSAAAASVSASPLHDVHEEGSESDGTLLRIAVCRQCPTEPESMESAVERAPAESQADGKPELTRKAEEMSCQEKCLQDNTASVLKQDMDSDASARPALSVRDMEDSDLVLPDLPSMPAGGVGFDDWMAMVSDRSGSVSNPSQLPPARRLDLNNANNLTVLSVGGEEPSPWSMMDARRVSGSTVGVVGKGRGTESPADFWKKQSPGSQASPTEHRSSDPSRIQEEKEDRPQPVQRGPNRPDSSETTQWLEEMNKASQVSATARITLSESEEPATHTAHAEAAHPVHGCQGGERSEQTEARDVLPSHTGAGVESLSSAEARLEGRNLDQKNRDSVTSGGVQHSHQPSGGARPKTTTTAMNQSGAGPKTTTTAMNQSGARPKTTSSAMNRSGLEETADVQHRKETAAESLEPGAQRATSQRENPSQNPLMAPAPTHVGNHDERCITASPLITQGELKEKEDFEYHLSSFENVKTYIDTDNLTSIFSSVIGPRDQPAEGSEIGDVAGRATASPDAGTHPLDSSRRGTQEAPATHQPHSSGQQRASGGASNPQGHLSSSESRLFQASSAGSSLRVQPATDTGPQKSHSTDSISTSEKSGEPADGKHPEPDRREEEASSQDTASRFGNEAQREATADSVDQTAEDVDEVKEGDIVVIRVSEERLVELQQCFGGTTKGMLRCIGKAGTVSGRTKRGAVCVKFRSLAYRFNPRVLMRVHEHHVGDTVRVRADLDLLKLLNMRVGFRSGLTETLGKVGTVTSIDEEGDLTVDFGQCNFQYSPACCLPAPGATPDTFGVGDTTVSGDNRERQKYMQELARMVKEGVSVSHLTVSPGADSSAISRLFEAIKDDNLTLVREMCQSDPSLLNGVHEERQLTTLMYASWKGQLDIVACLLDMGADVNGRLQMSRQIRHHSRYPLTAALESKQEETAALLLERGADPTVTLVNSCATPLHMAGSENLVQIAQILLQMGVDVNAVEKRGATPLMYALMANSRAVTDILLHADGLDLTLTDKRGMSPLHIACHENNTSAVEEILLRDQTHVNSLMAEGRYAPLHLAAEVDGVEIVRLMALVGSADVNIRVGGTGEHAQDTPLHRACLKGYYTCVEALLDFGADVNMENKDMETPLHYAMGGSLARDVQGEAELYFLEARVSIACLLIANGAFVDAENSKGRTCMRYGSPEIIGSVQNFIDQNRHLVRKKSGGQGSGQGALRGVALLCGVCQTRMSDIILLPCAHKAVCRDCMDQVTHCPVCKHRADSTTTDDRKGAQFQAIS